jgi:hypothetical protein
VAILLKIGGISIYAKQGNNAVVLIKPRSATIHFFAPAILINALAIDVLQCLN